MTTFVEYSPYVIVENHDLISRLSEAEISVTQERKSRDKQRLKQAEQQAERLRRELLSKADHSVLYLYLKSTQEANSDLFRTTWQNSPSVGPDPRWLTLLAPRLDLGTLPSGSFFIHFTFTLQKPYLSKDDNDFHITDNPLVREKVFRWPMVRPSGWKGALRHALWQSGHLEDDKQRCRIFGETGGDDTGQAGRLYLYPTFFAESGLEIINPHDREKRVGTKPILLECVPIRAKGTFTLLYVPFGPIGEDEQQIGHQVAEDLQLIAAGIRAMMTTYGFGAKTSSGFGLAEDLLSDGCLCVAGLDVPDGSISDPAGTRSGPALPRYLSAPGQLHPDLRAADGNLLDEAEYQRKIESQGQKYGKEEKQLYDKARRWWEREGEAAAEPVIPEIEPSEWQEPPHSPIANRPFASWDELVAKAAELSQWLVEGGA